MAVANPSNQPLDVLIAVGDLGGQQIGEVTVNVPANAAQAFFVDELVTIPTGHTGQVLIRPSNNPGPSVYVVGLRVTGLVITTIPAIVIRPELPTTGLNTSLTDPNGQWTATAKIIEKNDTYWEFSYFVDMTNRTDEEREYTVKIHFVDADGFSVEDSYAGDAFNKIPAKSTKRLLDRALINTENAPTVVGILLEVVPVARTGFTLFGTVSDGRRNGPLLAGAVVRLENGQRESTTTGPDGRYRFPNVSGTVTVTARSRAQLRSRDCRGHDGCGPHGRFHP